MDETASEEERRIFSERLEKAFAAHPEAPGRIYGRNVWLSERMGEMGRRVTTETARRWFAGMAVPRHRTMEALCDLLDVDPRYLMGEIDEMAPRPKRAPKPAPMPSDDTEAPAAHVPPAGLVMPRAAALQAARFIESWSLLVGMPVRAEGSQLVIEGHGWQSRIQVVAMQGRHAKIGFRNMGGTLTESLPHAIVALKPDGSLPRIFVMPAHLVEQMGGPGGGADVEAAPDGLVINGTETVLKALKALPDIFDML